MSRFTLGGWQQQLQRPESSRKFGAHRRAIEGLDFNDEQSVCSRQPGSFWRPCCRSRVAPCAGWTGQGLRIKNHQLDTLGTMKRSIAYPSLCTIKAFETGSQCLRSVFNTDISFETMQLSSPSGGVSHVTPLWPPPSTGQNGSGTLAVLRTPSVSSMLISLCCFVVWCCCRAASSLGSGCCLLVQQDGGLDRPNVTSL